MTFRDVGANTVVGEEEPSQLPGGVVTFLLTDVEGSTRLWEANPTAMEKALARHDAVMAEAIGRFGGVHVRSRGEGDSIFAVFPYAVDAVACACQLQRALTREGWTRGAEIRVRMAVHTGEAEVRDGSYYGPSVNRCARLRAIAHGGQTLLSRTTYELVSSTLPNSAAVIDLGVHRLKDIAAPEHVYQLAHPDIGKDFPPLLSVDLPGRELPVPLTSFIGRTDEMERVRKLLHTNRLLTLTGSGGCGKTRLALEIGARVRDRYKGGIHLVELAPLTSEAGVLPAIASALGSGARADYFPFEIARLRGAHSDELISAIAEFVHDRDTLLILDNCEHLIEIAAEAADVLVRAAPALTVLATSRESLGVAGEVTFRVPSLALPDDEPGAAEHVLEYEAIRLFLDRAQVANPELALTHDNAAAIVDVCRQLDGIPLAIELAAARSAILTPEQLSDRLGDRFRLLVGGSRTALPRQQTLKAAVEWSHDLLSTGEALVFARLAVFAGTFDLEAAENVAAGPEQLDVLTILGQLVDKSLVTCETWNDAAYRYGMLKTMRAFALQKLESAGELVATNDRHLAWYACVAALAREGLQDAGQGAWLEIIDLEHDNFTAALEWAEFGGGSVLDGLDLAVGIWRYWFVRGQLTEGRRNLQRALDAAPDAPTAVRASALNALGTMANQQGDHAAAAALHTSALEMATKADAREIMSDSLHGLANIALMEGRFDDARSDYQQALEVARAVGNTALMKKVLHNLGAIARMVNDLETAAAYYDESLSIARRLGDTRSMSMTLHNLADIARVQGDFQRARALFEESLDLARRIGYQQVVAANLGSLGNVAIHQRDIATARSRYQECLVIVQETGDRHMEAQTLNNLGTVAHEIGDELRAQLLYDQALSLARELGDNRVTASALLGLAHVGRSGGAWDGALALLGEAVALREEQAEEVAIGECLAAMAGIWLDKGDPGRAATLFGAAMAGRDAIARFDGTFDAETRARDLDECREELGVSSLDIALAEGAAMTLDAALHLALNASQTPLRRA